MSDVNALWTPLAVFSPLIAQKPEILVLKGRYFHNSYDITTSDNSLLLTVRNAWSFSMRSYVYDTDGTHLCTIRKESMKGGWRYYAESPTGDKGLFELETILDRHLRGPRETVRFINALTGKQELLCFRNPMRAKHNAIMDDSTGLRVAGFDREHWQMRAGYRLRAAPGADIVLIVEICISIQNKFACDLPTRVETAAKELSKEL